MSFPLVVCPESGYCTVAGAWTRRVHACLSCRTDCSPCGPGVTSCAGAGPVGAVWRTADARHPVRQRADRDGSRAACLAETPRQPAGPLRHGYRLDRHRRRRRALHAGTERHRRRSRSIDLQFERPHPERRALHHRSRDPARRVHPRRHRARSGAARLVHHLSGTRARLPAREQSAWRGLHGRRLRPHRRAGHRARRAAQSLRQPGLARLGRAALVCGRATS